MPFVFQVKKKKSHIIPYNFYNITMLKPLFKKPFIQNSKYKQHLSEKLCQSTFFPQYTETTLPGRLLLRQIASPIEEKISDFFSKHIL